MSSGTYRSSRYPSNPCLRKRAWCTPKLLNTAEVYRVGAPMLDLICREVEKALSGVSLGARANYYFFPP